MSEKESEPPKENPTKKVWTDQERLELAAKLDKHLEDYIDNLDKKSYTDGWPEDRWQEEMEKHPFFMTQMPEDSSEISPLIEGLQQLKYGEEYNTPNELAQSYKEDGNFNYKHKKYRLAILSFTKGISSKCEDKDLLATLYNNRALAQLKLENYRSSLNDCKQALKLKPDYVKALYTAAKCCFAVADNSQCINYCDAAININNSKNEQDKEIICLRNDAIKSKKTHERNSRLKDITAKKKAEAQKEILKIIKERCINVNESDIFCDQNFNVHLDDDLLIWPVVFFYPESKQTDFVEKFNECTTIEEQLEELFEEPPAWDKDRRYQIDKLNVYFEGFDRKMYKVDIKQTLCHVLQHKMLIVQKGTPCFSVLVANSKAEEVFLKS